MPIQNPRIRASKSKIPTLITFQTWILARSYQLLAFAHWYFKAALQIGANTSARYGKGRKAEKTTKERFIQLLVNGPKSSIQLTGKLQCTQDYTTQIGKELVAEGKIIAQREKTRRACQWYALPYHADRLPSLIGMGVKGKVLKLLKTVPWLSIKQMRCHLPEYSHSSIREAAWQLVATGKLVAKGEKELRRYAAREKREILEKSHPQVSQAIVDLLRVSPGLWQQAIVRRLPYPERTVGDHIKRMKQSGILLPLRHPCDRRTFLYVTTPAPEIDQ